MRNNQSNHTPTTFGNRIGAAVWGAIGATMIAICLFAMSATFKNNADYAVMRWIGAHLTIHAFLTLVAACAAMGFVFGTHWLDTVFGVLWSTDTSRNAAKGSSSWNLGTVLVLVAILAWLAWYFL